MPAKQLKAVLKRKAGQQYWVVDCPYCGNRHWLKAGNYATPPELALGNRVLPCGSSVTVIPDKPLIIDRTGEEELRFKLYSKGKLIAAFVNLIDLEVAMEALQEQFPDATFTYKNNAL